jgi:predicted alpha/beta-fold hydrolase
MNAHAALLVHGIGGTSESRAMVRAGAALHRAGFHVVRLNLRGAGDGLREARSLYHAGLSSDLARAVRLLGGHSRVRGVVVLGVSGGGSMALKLAGEWGDRAPACLRAIATISAPLDYVQVARQMERLRTLPYRRYVLGNLARMAVAFARLRPELAPYDAAAVGRARTFREFDERVIVPMHGMSGVDANYRSASSGPWLARVAVPTMLVHADDDPMVPGRTLLPWLDTASPAVRFARAARGGHVGFIGGLHEDAWINGWANARVLAFFRECVSR